MPIEPDRTVRRGAENRKQPKRSEEAAMSKVLKEQFMKDFDSLPTDKQREVNELVQKLKTATPKLTSGKDWLKLAGAIDAESLAEMEAAIKDCRQVDPREW